MTVSPPSSPKSDRPVLASPERLGGISLPQVPKVEEVAARSLKSKRRRDHFPVDVLPAKRPRISQDRYISSINKNGAAVYNDPKPVGLKGARESTYQAALAQGIFGSFRDPHSEPVLRPPPAARSFEPPPTIPQSEVYPLFHDSAYETTDFRELDLSAICEGLRTLPFACNRDVLSLIRYYANSSDPSTRAQINVWITGESRTVVIPSLDEELMGDQKPIAAAVAPEGELLVFAKENGEIEGWELTDQDPCKLFEIKPWGESKIISLGISDRSIFAGDHQGRLFQIDREKKTLIQTFKDHDKCICKIVVSPDEKYLATGGLDRQVVIYKTATMKKLHAVPCKDEIKAIVFDPAGNSNIAVGVGTSQSRICIVKFPNPPKETAMIEIPVDPQLSSLQWPMASRMISTHADRSFRSFPVDLRKKIPLGPSRSFSSASMTDSSGERNFSALIPYKNPKFLLCGSANRMVEVFVLPKNLEKASAKHDIAFPLIR